MDAEIKLRGIHISGSLLGLCILAILVMYWNSMHTLIAGLLYLMAAILLNAACFSVAAISRARARQVFPHVSSLSLRIRSYALLLAAWQIAIVGVLNISSLDVRRFQVPFAIDYLLTAIFVFACYKFVTIADSPNQDGGYVPLNFFGYPRTRRLVFVLFGGLCVIYPFIVASIDFAVRGSRVPAVFRPPQLCLLLAAILSLMSSGLVFDRYHVMAVNKQLRKQIFVATLCFLVSAAIIQQLCSYSMYVFTLSAIVIIATGLTVFYLWRIAQSPPRGVQPLSMWSNSAQLGG